MNSFFNLLPLLTLLVAIFRQNLPHGYIFAAGDFTSVINFPYTLSQLGHLWQTYGEGNQNNIFAYYPYYFLLSLFRKITGGDFDFLYNPLIIFLGSYFSFRQFSKDFIKAKEGSWVTVVSTLYALNGYTFIRALTPTPFIILYVFIPLIFSYTKSYFLSNKIISAELARFGSLMFLVNIAFGNAPYFIALNILLFIYIVLIHVIFGIQNCMKVMIRLLVFYLFMFLTTFVSIVPQIPSLLSMSQSFQSNTNVFNLSDWIYWQALDISSILSFSDGIMHTLSLFSPLILTSIFVVPFIFFLSLFTRANNTDSEKRHLIIFPILVIITMFITNKGRGLVSRQTTDFIFDNLLLSSIRSIDKALIFLPFFALSTVLIALRNIRLKYQYLILLLGTIPFLVILSNNVFISKVGLDEGKKFQESKYAYVVKIPQDYLDLSHQINTEPEDFKIMSMPWAVVNSIGWTNYPKWKELGSDPTIQLIEKPIIQMNSPSPFGRWNYGEVWNLEATTSGDWIVDLASLMNVKYLLYHKDVEKYFLSQTIAKLEHLISTGLIKLKSSYENFDLYEIGNDKYLSHFYLPTNTIISDDTTVSLPNILSSNTRLDNLSIIFTNQNITRVEMIRHIPLNHISDAVVSAIKISPTKYKISLKGVTKQQQMVFSETYSKYWNLYPGNFSKIEHVSDTWFKNSIESDHHFVVNGYANGWWLDSSAICKDYPDSCSINPDQTYNVDLIVEFWPQRLLYLGLAISGSTFLICVLYLVIKEVRR